MIGNIVAEDTPQTEKPKHTYLGTFWNFIKGEALPQETFTDYHVEKYERYIDPGLSEFEKAEQAVLFGETRYHFDNALDLRFLHEDPVLYMNHMWLETYGASNELHKCHQSVESDLSYAASYREKACEQEFIQWHKNREEEVRWAKFKLDVLDLARKFAICYHQLSKKEQQLSARRIYGKNGIYNSNPGLELLCDVYAVRKTFGIAKIDKDEKAILQDLATTTKNFRDDACKEDDARLSKLSEFARYKNPNPQTHTCLYATLLTQYVALAQKFEEERCANR